MNRFKSFSRNTLGDYLCINQVCSHVNCNCSLESYVTSRLHKLRNTNLSTLSFQDKEYTRYDFSDLYDVAFEVLPLGEFVQLMDNSAYFKEATDSFPYKYWRTLERYLIRSINETKSVEFLFTFLEHFALPHKNVSLKTKQNLRSRNLKLMKTFLHYYVKDGVSTYDTMFKVEQQIDLNLFGASTIQKVDKAFDSIKTSAESINNKYSECATSLNDSVSLIAPQVATSINSVTKTLVDSTKTVTNGFNQMTETTNKLLSDISTSSSDILTNLSKLIENTNRDDSIFGVIIKSVKTNITGIIAQLTLLPTLTSTTQVIAGLTSMCSLCGVDNVIFNRILKAFSSPKQEASRPATTKLLGILSLVLGKASPLKHVNIQNLTMLSKEMNAAEDLIKTFESMLEEWGIYESPEAKAAKMIKEDIVYLLDAYLNYEASWVIDSKEFFRPQVYNRFEQDNKRISELKSNSIGSHEAIVRDINSLNTSYKALAAKIADLRSGNTRRQEPVAVCLLGLPGIGKSELMVDLVSRTSAGHSLLAEYIETHTWAKNDTYIQELDIPDWSVWAENKSSDMRFQDGFYGQEAHTVDDAFQNSDDSDHINYINYISGSKHITNQADLQSKGRAYESKILLASANRFPKTSKTIKSVDALHRRFMVIECVQIKPLPPNGKKDRTYDHLQFLYWPDGRGYVYNNSNPEILDLEGVLTKIIESLSRKTRYFESSQQQLSGCPFFQEVSGMEMAYYMTQSEYMHNEIARNPYHAGENGETQEIYSFMKAYRKLKWPDGQYVNDFNNEKQHAPDEEQQAVELQIYLDQLLENWQELDQTIFNNFINKVRGKNLHVMGLFKAIDFRTMSWCDITDPFVYQMIADSSDNIYSETFCDFPEDFTYYEYHRRYSPERQDDLPESNPATDNYRYRYCEKSRHWDSDEENEDEYPQFNHNPYSDRQKWKRGEPFTRQQGFKAWFQSVKWNIMQWYAHFKRHPLSAIGSLLKTAIFSGIAAYWAVCQGIAKCSIKIASFIFWLFGISPLDMPSGFQVLSILISFLSVHVICFCILFVVSFIVTKVRLYNHACNSCSTHYIEDVFDLARKHYCNTKCQAGYIYSTHTIECKNLEKLCTAHLKTICSCYGKCQKCVHVYDLEFDERYRGFFEEFLINEHLDIYQVVQESKSCGCSFDVICTICSKSKKTIIQHFDTFAFRDMDNYNPYVMEFNINRLEKTRLLSHHLLPRDFVADELPFPERSELTPCQIRYNNWKRDNFGLEGDSSTSTRRQRVVREGDSSTSTRRRKVVREGRIARVQEITLITGNAKKYEEFKSLYKCSIPVHRFNVDLTEIQGTSEEVCIAKCKEAARQVNGPVIIEDVSLSFRAHEPRSYPGPYIKSVMGALGVDGLYQSLEGKDNRATATCIYAYCSNEDEKVHLFVGETKGYIEPPRGDRSFGWDCIFRPKHHDKTFSEMTLSEKNQVSPRSKAIQKLVAYLMPLTETLDNEVVSELAQFAKPIYSNTPEPQAQSDHCKGLVVLTNSKTITKTQCELECLKLINPKHIVAFDNFSAPTAQLLSRTAGYFDVPILLYYEFPNENYCIYAYWDQLDQRCPVVLNRMDKPLSLSFLFNLIRATQQPRPQMSVDRAAKDIVKKMQSHIVPVRNSKGKLHGIVHGQWVLTPSHIGPSCKALLHKSTWVELELVSTRPDWDLSLWKFNNPSLSYAQAPFKYVPNREELIRHVSGHSVSMTFLPSDEYGWVGNVALQYNKEFAAGKFDEILAVNGVTASSIPTVSGDCGAPTILCSPTLKHKWIGIHILGSKWNAYSTLVTKERLFALGYTPEKTVYEDAVEELVSEEEEMNIDFDGDAELQIDTTFPVIDDMNLCPLKLEKPRIPSVKEIEYVGQTSYNAYPAKKTNLIKHPFYGTFPVTKVPSALTIDQVIDPSRLAKDANGNPDMILTQLKKYEDFPTVVDDVKEKLDTMIPQMIDHMKYVMGDCDYTPLSNEDALSGLMLDPQSKSLDMRTSSGEPWTRVGKTDGKKKGAFLTITRGECDQKRYNFNTDTEHGRVLVEAIDRKEKLAKRRVRTLSLWKNCLKDETRDRDKVAIGKTRLFVTAPFESVFLMRKYLEPFKNQWQKCRIKLPHAVGIDPCSAEWSHLVYALQASGLEMNDADFGQFDGRLRADFMRAAGKVVLGVIDPEDDEVRAVIETLWEEMVETFHLTYNMVHLTRHGNPSGNPYTTVINCLVNFMYHWFCFMRITNTSSLRVFQNEVSIFVFGDDVIFSKSPLSKFTFNAVAPIMYELGQEYTNIEKDGTTSDMKPLNKIKFLQRSFVKLTGGVYLAPLKTESIEQQFNYTNIQSDDKLTIMVQLDEALLEAATHNREYYTTFTSAIKQAVERSPYLRNYVENPFFFYHEDRARLFKRLGLMSQPVLTSD